MHSQDTYTIHGVHCHDIRNRNEARVLKVLNELLQTKSALLLSHKDIQDIYALALNALPPRYAQRGTIVLRDPVTKEDVRLAVEDAFSLVMEHPKS